jgi:hypothetical protein
MMPAGKYYIGDLCYVMDDAEWLEVCDLTIRGSRVIDGEFQLKDGRRFAMYGTAYGDGTYHDHYGFSYSVDSGSIGCIRMEDIKASNTYSLGDTQAILDFGAIQDFDTDFVTGGGIAGGMPGWEGLIQFGHIVIETDPTEEEEYE